MMAVCHVGVVPLWGQMEVITWWWSCSGVGHVLAVVVTWWWWSCDGGDHVVVVMW